MAENNQNKFATLIEKIRDEKNNEIGEREIKYSDDDKYRFEQESYLNSENKLETRQRATYDKKTNDLICMHSYSYQNDKTYVASFEKDKGELICRTYKNKDDKNAEKTINYKEELNKLYSENQKNDNPEDADYQKKSEKILTLTKELLTRYSNFPECPLKNELKGSLESLIAQIKGGMTKDNTYSLNKEIDTFNENLKIKGAEALNIDTLYTEKTQENGNYIEKKYNSGRILESKKEFNSNDNPLSEEIYYDGKNVQYYRTFHNNGRIKNEISYYDTGKIRSESSYDENRNITSYSEYDSNGKLIKKTEYKDRITYVDKYNSEEKIETRKKYYNDPSTDDPELMETTSYNHNEDGSYTTTIEDAEGNHIADEEYNQNKQITSRTEYLDNDTKLTEENYTYDNDKLKSLTVTHYKSDHNPGNTDEYEYDDQEKITKKTTKDENGETKSIRNYIYSKDGKLDYIEVRNDQDEVIAAEYLDKNNRLREEEKFENNKHIQTKYYMYDNDYDNDYTAITSKIDGPIISKTMSKHEFDSEKNEKIIEIDPKTHNYIQASEFNTFGQLISYSIYEYNNDERIEKIIDTNNNRIKDIHYDKDGKITSELKYKDNHKSIENIYDKDGSQTIISYDEFGSKSLEQKFDKNGYPTENKSYDEYDNKIITTYDANHVITSREKLNQRDELIAPLPRIDTNDNNLTVEKVLNSEDIKDYVYGLSDERNSLENILDRIDIEGEDFEIDDLAIAYQYFDEHPSPEDQAKLDRVAQNFLSKRTEEDFSPDTLFAYTYVASRISDNDTKTDINTKLQSYINNNLYDLQDYFENISNKRTQNTIENLLDSTKQDNKIDPQNYINQIEFPIKKENLKLTLSLKDPEEIAKALANPDDMLVALNLTEYDDTSFTDIDRINIIHATNILLDRTEPKNINPDNATALALLNNELKRHIIDFHGFDTDSYDSKIAEGLKAYDKKNYTSGLTAEDMNNNYKDAQKQLNNNAELLNYSKKLLEGYTFTDDKGKELKDPGLTKKIFNKVFRPEVVSLKKTQESVIDMAREMTAIQLSQNPLSGDEAANQKRLKDLMKDNIETILYPNETGHPKIFSTSVIAARLAVCQTKNETFQTRTQQKFKNKTFGSSIKTYLKKLDNNLTKRFGNKYTKAKRLAKVLGRVSWTAAKNAGMFVAAASFGQPGIAVYMAYSTIKQWKNVAPQLKNPNISKRKRIALALGAVVSTGLSAMTATPGVGELMGMLNINPGTAIANISNVATTIGMGGRIAASTVSAMAPAMTERAGIGIELKGAKSEFIKISKMDNKKYEAYVLDPDNKKKIEKIKSQIKGPLTKGAYLNFCINKINNLQKQAARANEEILTTGLSSGVGFAVGMGINHGIHEGMDHLKDFFDENSAETAQANAQANAQQTGDQQNGDQQNGDQQNGDQQNGDQQTGDQQNGDQQNGDQQNGDQQNGDQQTGDQQTGDQQTGDQQNGDQQNGDQQTGDQQNGDQQNGDQQNGDQQNGDQQNGDQQNGDQQNGDQQNGDQQNGDQQNGGQQNAEPTAEKQAQANLKEAEETKITEHSNMTVKDHTKLHLNNLGDDRIDVDKMTQSMSEQFGDKANLTTIAAKMAPYALRDALDIKLPEGQQPTTHNMLNYLAEHGIPEGKEAAFNEFMTKNFEGTNIKMENFASYNHSTTTTTTTVTQQPVQDQQPVQTQAQPAQQFQAANNQELRPTPNNNPELQNWGLKYVQGELRDMNPRQQMQPEAAYAEQRLVSASQYDPRYDQSDAQYSLANRVSHHAPIAPHISEKLNGNYVSGSRDMQTGDFRLSHVNSLGDVETNTYSERFIKESLENHTHMFNEANYDASQLKYEAGMYGGHRAVYGSGYISQGNENMQKVYNTVDAMHEFTGVARNIACLADQIKSIKGR